MKPSFEKEKEKTAAVAKSKGVVDCTLGDFNYYTRWLIRQATYAPKIFDSHFNNKICTFDKVEIGGKICTNVLDIRIIDTGGILSLFT